MPEPMTDDPNPELKPLARVPVPEWNLIERIGNAIYKGRRFDGVPNAESAMTVILAGAELGFGPITSMAGIHLIKGHVTLSASLMAAAIKRSQRYDFRLKRLDATGCEIEFFEDGATVGVSSFTLQDAKTAGLAGGENYQKYPRNMLFSRAMSNGAKWYCAEVFAGPVYTPDELGARVNDRGEVVDAEWTATSPPPAVATPAGGPAHAAGSVVSTGAPGLTLEALIEHYGPDEVFEAAGGVLPESPERLARVAAVLDAAHGAMPTVEAAG